MPPQRCFQPLPVKNRHNSRHHHPKVQSDAGYPRMRLCGVWWIVRPQDLDRRMRPNPQNPVIIKQELASNSWQGGVQLVHQRSPPAFNARPTMKPLWPLFVDSTSSLDRLERGNLSRAGIRG
jgi:hypothetical protein